LLFLHERFQPFHAVGIGLIASGILLASVRRPVAKMVRLPNRT
jgi:drug/metabolite transporter (DMT)-like permease